jgi:hypothetical protein
MKTGGVLLAMHAFSQATRGERTAWQPGLALELAFMDAVHSPPEARSKVKEIEPGSDAAPRPESGSGSMAAIASAPKVEPVPEVSSEGTGPERKEETVPAGREPKEEGEPAGPEPNVEGSHAGREPKLEDTPVRNEPEAVPIVEEDSAQIAKDSPGDQPKSQAGSDFQRVLDAWPELLRVAYGRDPQTQALLNSGEPLAVDDNSLVLGFQSDLLREKMEKGPNREIVSEALSEVINAKLGVRCVLLQDWGSNRSTAPTVPLPEGGMVAAALRDLGAEVVDYGPETETASATPNWERRAEDSKDEEER